MNAIPAAVNTNSCEGDPMGACLWCNELLADNERHPLVRTMHKECAVRSVVGSIAHIEGRCRCYCPGSEEDDPPELSRREAARVAYVAFCRHERLL